MAITSGLFNSMNGDRKYNAFWFAKYFSTFIGNGVFPNPSTGMQVIEGENMRTIVKAGDGWINGYFIHNDSNYVLEHDLADGVLKRIDRIVMRLNFITRRIECVIKKGSFASNPVAPNLQRDADYHELALADVLINNGATTITQANITDNRLNSALCGIVHGTVDQVDTTTLYNQYLDFWESWRTGKMDQFEQFLIDAQIEFDQQTDNNQFTFDNQTIMNQQEFDDWFVTVQGILEGDVAGNLLTMINAINDSKGQPNGIATLDGEGIIPTEQMPEMPYIPTAEKGEPLGVATLDENGIVLSSQSKKGGYIQDLEGEIYIPNVVKSAITNLGIQVSTLNNITEVENRDGFVYIINQQRSRITKYSSFELVEVTFINLSSYGDVYKFIIKEDCLYVITTNYLLQLDIETLEVIMSKGNDGYYNAITDDEDFIYIAKYGISPVRKISKVDFSTIAESPNFTYGSIESMTVFNGNLYACGGVNGGSEKGVTISYNVSNMSTLAQSALSDKNHYAIKTDDLGHMVVSVADMMLKAINPSTLGYMAVSQNLGGGIANFDFNNSKVYASTIYPHIIEMTMPSFGSRSNLGYTTYSVRNFTVDKGGTFYVTSSTPQDALYIFGYLYTIPNYRRLSL